MPTYKAELTPLNAAKIGCAPHGTVTFTETATSLKIRLEMFDTPAEIQHWEHFHGFPDGRAATVPTAAQDTNHDGFIDLPETAVVSGTTMVPLDAAPHEMCIPNDHYPVADANGHYAYEKEVPLAKLKAKFEETFHTADLALDKRVVYVHGVPADLELPETVGGKINDDYDQHVTLPIAAGRIERVD